MALIKDNNMVNLQKEFPDYSVYALAQDEICLFVVPNTISGKLSLYLDMNSKSDYDSLVGGQISKDVVVDKIVEDYKVLKNNNPNSIYVLPNFDVAKLEQALNNGISDNKQDIFTAISGIGVDTKKIQSVLASVGASIDTTINVVVKTDTDSKFAKFLESQKMGVGYDFRSIKSNSQVSSEPVNQSSFNPFADSTPVNNVGEGPNAVAQDNVVPAQGEEEANNNLQQPIEVQPENLIPQTEPTPVQSIPLTSDDLSETRALGSELSGLGDAQGEQDLKNEQSVEENQSGYVKTRKKNGYVNIVIFMAILVGVTMLSIQIGKFLYSVYG